MAKPRAWDTFTAGKHISGVTVLELVDDHPSVKKTIYSLKYDCCGREANMSHYRLCRKIKIGRMECPSCAIQKSLQARKAAKEGKIKTLLKGAEDERGYHWPSLNWAPLGGV
jgi:hypothetical protein